MNSQSATVSSIEMFKSLFGKRQKMRLVEVDRSRAVIHFTTHTNTYSFSLFATFSSIRYQKIFFVLFGERITVSIK